MNNFNTSGGYGKEPENHICSQPLCDNQAVYRHQLRYEDKYLCGDHNYITCNECIGEGDGIDGEIQGAWIDEEEKRVIDEGEQEPYLNTQWGILNNQQVNNWNEGQNAMEVEVPDEENENFHLIKLHTCIGEDGKKQHWAKDVAKDFDYYLCPQHTREKEDIARRYIRDVQGKKGQLFNENHLRAIKNKGRSRVPTLQTLVKNSLSTKNMQTSRQYVLAGPETLKKRTGGRKRNKTRKRKKKRKRKTHKKKRRQRKSKKKRKAKK